MKKKITEDADIYKKNIRLRVPDIINKVNSLDQN